MVKKVLLFCPGESVACVNCALEDFEGLDIAQAHDLSDVLGALETRPDLVILKIDCHQMAMMPAVAKAEDLKVPCIVVWCQHVLDPSLRDRDPSLRDGPKRKVFQFHEGGLFDKIEAAAREFLGQ